MLRLLLQEKNITLYKLEKTSDISHATLNDLYNEKTNVERCSSSLIHSIARQLDMSMDELYDVLSYDNLNLVTYDDAFDLFKSNVCHELKDLGDIEFIKKHLKNNTVDIYFNNQDLLRSLYLLSMIDHLCLEHNLPLVKNYDHIRKYKMDKLYVSKSIYLLLKTKAITISKIYKESIKTFIEHNILESDIRNVA